MQNKILSRQQKNKKAISLDAASSLQKKSQSKLEKSRIAILNGWIISMLGVACYCFAMLGNETTADPFSSIFERGMIGWAAVIFTVIGLGLWLTGCLTYLWESEQMADKDESSTGI